mgnify:CR=1 FL=1
MNLLIFLQSLITILSIITGFFAVAQIRLLLERKSAKDISFIYQFAVWLNALISLIALTIIGSMIGFQNVFGHIVCSAECTVLVGIILFLIVKYRRR